jgi:outer membrane protein
MKKSLTSLVISALFAGSCQYAVADDLLSVFNQAMQYDPKILKAQSQFFAAEQDIEIARSVLLPQINFSGSVSTSENESFNLAKNDLVTFESDNTRYGFDLSMQIYHHDSWLRLDNSKKAAHQLDVSYQVSKQDLIVRVTQAYFDVLKAQDDLEFATAEKKAIERQLEQTKQRFSVGLTAITDVHEAQAEFDNAVAEEIRAQNAIYAAEEALREITNVYPKNLSVLNTELFSTTRPTPDSANEWQSLAEAKSLNIIAQKIAVDIAKENIDIAQAGHLPTLSFSGNLGRDKTSTDANIPDPLDPGSDKTSFPDPWTDSHSIAIQLNVPIYSGNRVSSETEKARHNYVVASQDLESAHRSVVRNTRNSYNNIIATISGIKAFEQSVISAESALKATEAGFEVGTRTIVDVLDSTRNLYNAKRNLSSTRYAYINSILQLKLAAGTISAKDLQDINSGLQKLN